MPYWPPDFPVFTTWKELAPCAVSRPVLAIPPEGWAIARTCHFGRSQLSLGGDMLSRQLPFPLSGTSAFMGDFYAHLHKRCDSLFLLRVAEVGWLNFFSQTTFWDMCPNNEHDWFWAFHTNTPPTRDIIEKGVPLISSLSLGAAQVSIGHITQGKRAPKDEEAAQGKGAWPFSKLLNCVKIHPPPLSPLSIWAGIVGCVF